MNESKAIHTRDGMIVLVINSSSSLKYQLIDMDKETVLARGLCERIGLTIR